MPATLATGRNPYLNPTHWQSRDGETFILNGLNRMQRWNGKAAASQDAGITAPTTAVSVSASGSSNPNGTYYAYVRFVDAEGIPSSFGPVSAAVSPASQQINYTNIPVSTESRVTKREIWRNTNGQTTTFFLDITINDNVTTTGTGVKSDATLEAQDELPLNDDDGNPYATRFGVPPSTKRVAIDLHGRTLYGVSAVYDEGSAEVTSGSTTVTIRGGTVTADFANRYLFIPGQTTAYLISSVSTSLNTLTLSASYGGSTNLFSDYSIQELEDDQNSWFYSYVGEPESVFATDSFKVEHYDGDVDTAAFRLGQSLFVAQRQNLWQVAFADDPACDLTTRHIAFRGCVNPLCWAAADGMIFALDRRGVYAFDGTKVTPLSDPIQDLWRRDSRYGTHDYKLNWQTADRWFATANPVEQVVRFHVQLGGGPYPKEALCFHYVRGHWWIEGSPWPLGASTCFHLEGRRIPCVGRRNELLAMNGTFDRVIANSGVTRAYATAATLNTVTLTGSTLPNGQLVGSPIAIVGGLGAGQLRRIAAVSGSAITVDKPWGIRPDTTSEVLLGAIDWRWRSKLFQFPALETDSVRRAMLAAQPTTNRATMNMRLFYDHEMRSATKNRVAFNRLGAASDRDTTDVTWDLQKNPSTDNPDVGDWTGFRDWNLDYRLEDEGMGSRWVAVELAGFQGGDSICIYGLDIDGVIEAQKRA